MADQDREDFPGQGELVVHQPAEPTPMAMIGSIVDLAKSGQLTPEALAAMQKVIEMKEHMEDRQAEKDFAVAFAALQSELTTFRATKVVPGKNDAVRYTYLPYEEIMAKVRPLLDKFGFSVSFSTEFKDSRILQTCTLQHRGGYHRDYKAYVRAGSGPYGATETQADGAAMTYAKRYALSNALNITVEHDTDARAEGGPISDVQVQTLKDLVVAARADEAKFLKFAGAATYEEIGAKRFSELVATLNKKMNRFDG
jgi:hypothetical protein